MFSLSANYHHRKCYFKKEQVPTQTVMKKIMTEPLAMVYFKSMNYKLKVLAGLEPPMQGGGTEWYQPPEEQLAGRAVLKPIELQLLKWLGFLGLTRYGGRLRETHYNKLIEEKRRFLEDNENNWKLKILNSNTEHYGDCAKAESERITKLLLNAVREFELLYRTSVTKLEDLVLEAAMTEIKRIRKEAYDHMRERLTQFIKVQATRMYEEYEEKLNNDKARLKAEFKEDMENIRTYLSNEVHDINFVKHLAIEKLRHFLHCKNLACQIYVALKEKEECEKEMDKTKHEHKKKIRSIEDEIKQKKLEIHLEIEQQQKRQEFDRVWRKKVCHVVKKFQLFVEYCLKLLPNHAEFFLNMEKLMMMQLAQAVDNPSAESIIKPDSGFKTPVPRPHPFYLFCDKGFKPKVDQKLCPKHCTSSASQLPVIVINKRCIYAACDNFEVFADKVSQYIYGNRGDDADVEDLHEYRGVPVKYTASTRLEELKLESSLMQVLQQELPNIRNLPVDCSICKVPYCFCSPLHTSQIELRIGMDMEPPPPPKVIVNKITSDNKLTRKSELQFLREPKWESYLDFVKSKKCICAAMAKKHLDEHLPPYMKIMSQYDAPELPNYEPCSIEHLKRMVKKARCVVTPPPTPEPIPSKTKDIATQYSDQEMENLCTCFSDDEVAKLFEVLRVSKMFDKKTLPTECDIIDGSITASHMKQTASSFATERAYSLRNLLDDAPQLEEIFMKPDCDCYEKYPNKEKCEPDDF